MDKDMTVKKTFCQVCDRYCGIDLHVEEGELVKVRGSKNHPMNQGRLCPKGLQAKEIRNSEERIDTPLKDCGEGWREISWEEALSEISEKFENIKDKYGAWAVAWDDGHGSMNPFLGRLMHLFGSPTHLGRNHICYMPNWIALKYTIGEDIFPDLKNTSCLVLWGKNPPHTSPVEMRHYREFFSSDRKLIVVDPRETSIASKADLWLQIRPGTDGALALGMINVIIENGLFDEKFVEKWTKGFDSLKETVENYTPERVEGITWVKAEKIEKAAKIYASNHPSCIDIGNGIEQHTNTFQTARAINCLIPLTGNLDVQGGNVFSNQISLKDIGKKESLSQEDLEKRIGSQEYPLLAECNQASYKSFLERIEKGENSPRALLVMGGNPVLTLGNSDRVREALSKLDFIVVSDFVISETAEMADIILPSGELYQSRGIHLYKPGSGYPPHLDPFVLSSSPLPKIGERKSDLETIFELAGSLGLESEFWNGDIERGLNEYLEPTGVSMEDLQEEKEGIRINVERTRRKYEKGLLREDGEKGFSTPSGRVELYSEKLEERGYQPVPDYNEPGESPVSKPELAEKYPLILSSGKVPSYTHASFRWVSSLRKMHSDPLIRINPKTAKRHGVENGEWVKIESPRGSCEMKAKLTESVHPRIVFGSHGWRGEQNLNALTDNEDVDPILTTEPLKSSLCRIKNI